MVKDLINETLEYYFKELRSCEDIYINSKLKGIEKIFLKFETKFGRSHLVDITLDFFYRKLIYHNPDIDGIDDIVEDHMCKVCDWYDKMLFGENAGDFLGMNKGVNDLMASMGKWDNIKGWDEPTPKEKEDFYKIKGIDTKNLPTEIKGPNGTIKL